MAGSIVILWRELRNHLPYSGFATAAGIILAGIMLTMSIIIVSAGAGHEADGTHALAEEMHAAEGEASGHEHEHEHEHEAEHGHAHGHAAMHEGSAILQEASHVTFHVFHPVHMFFSAIATTAMFWRYDRRRIVAILTGLIGSLGVCSVSDVFMPYLSGLILGTEHMTFHWCLAQHPMLVVPFAVVGVFVGMIAAETVTRSTYFSHSAHVFVSSAASIFYLVSFGVTDWADKLGYVFILMILAVTIPCCVSDIVVPLLVARKNSDFRGCAAHPHGEGEGKKEV